MSFTQKITTGTVQFDTANGAGLLDVAPSTTTLAAAISSPITTATAISTSAAVGPNSSYIKIGTEYLQVQSGGGTTAPTVIGGQLGSTAATHANAATVNLPGYLVYNLLTIAQAPNVELFLRKTTTDINYVAVTAAGGNTFPGGGTTILLTDNQTNGTLHLKFPGSGTVLLVLASGGGGMAGSAGPAGPPGTPTPPAQPTGVTGAEVGSRTAVALQRTQLTVRVTCTLAGGSTADRAEVWLSQDGGGSWQDQGEFPFNPASPMVDFFAYAPTTSQSWHVKVNLGNVSAYNDPATAVVSSAFSVAAIALPGTNLISAVSINAITGVAYNDVTLEYDGNHIPYFGLPDGLSVTCGGASAEGWYLTATARVVDGSGNPAPAEQGGVESSHIDEIEYVNGKTYDKFAKDLDWWEFNPSGSVYTVVRLEFWAYRRPGTSSDRVKQILPSTLDHLDFTFGPPPPDRFDGTGLYQGVNGKPTVATAGDPANLMGNSRFDDALTGWSIYQGTATPTAFGAGTTLGANSMTLTGDPSHIAYIYQTVGVDSAKRHFVSMLYRISSFTGGPHAIMVVHYLDNAGTQLSLDVVDVVATGGWQQSISFTTPVPPAGTVKMRFLFGGYNLSTSNITIDSPRVIEQTPTGAGTQPDGAGGVQVKLTGPLYTDISGNVNLHIASDFVVSGGVLTQAAVDLAKSVNFDTTNFVVTGGHLVVNAIAVNQLIAGTALFAGDVILARSGGGKVTLNSAGIALADQNISPNSTFTLASTGVTAAKGSNSVTITASGVQLQDGSGNSLTMTSSGVAISRGSSSVTVASGGVAIVQGTLTLNLNGTTTSITNTTLAGVVGVGLSLRDNFTGIHSVETADGFYLLNNTNQVFANVTHAPTGAPRGIIAVYNPATGGSILLDPDNGIFVNGVLVTVP